MTEEQSLQIPKELTDLTPFARAEAMVVATDEDASYATDLRSQAKTRLKKIEEQRKFLKEPALEQCRRIDQMAASACLPFNGIVKVLDVKLVDWDTLQRQKRIDEEKARRAALQAQLDAEKAAQMAKAMEGDEDAAEAVAEIERNTERIMAAPIAPATGIKTAHGNFYVQERWTYEIVDAERIPRSFLMVDEVKLGKYAVAMKEHAVVDGVRFFTKQVPGGR